MANRPALGWWGGGGGGGWGRAGEGGGGGGGGGERGKKGGPGELSRIMWINLGSSRSSLAGIKTPLGVRLVKMERS